jgi:N-acetylmuramoyl-L-alanine amidase CwlA
MPTQFLERFNIMSNYIPSPSKRRSGQFIQKVRFLVAHDTGNPDSTARGNVKYYINSRNEQSASAHIFVDDKEIIECVPALTGRPEKAWHVLYNVPKDNELYGANANDAAIGVEYCFGEHINSDLAYDRYVWVLAKLCYVFNLNPARDIIGHHLLDPKRKTDPQTGLMRSRRSYEQLLRDIVTEYNRCTGKQQEETNAKEEAGEATVAVTLRMRERPDTRSEIKGKLQAYTVVKYKAVVTNGESINNNPVWYQLDNGYYIWSGGVLSIKPAAAVV